MGTYSDRARELLELIAAIVDEEATLGTQDLGRRVADRISDECGGQQVYFPFDRARRDGRIYTEWKGGLTVPQLASRFRLSTQHIYDILNKEKKRRSLAQAALPGVVPKEGLH